MTDPRITVMSKQIHELTEAIEAARAEILHLRRQVERPELPMVATVCHLAEVVERRLEPLRLSETQRADLDYWGRYTGVRGPL